MINLLAPADKRDLQKEYRRHKLVVAGFVWCLVSAAIVIIFASLYVILYFDQREISTSLVKAKDEYAAIASTTSERAILTVNQQASLLLTPSPFLPAALLERLVSLRPAGVLLNSIDYRPVGKEILVALDGQASSRQDFLRFLNKLKSDSTFLAVDSPVGNLIRERNVRFNLILHIKL